MLAASLQAFAGEDFGRRNEYPGDMGEAPIRTARESKTKDYGQRYLQGNPSHNPPLHNLVTGT